MKNKHFTRTVAFLLALLTIVSSFAVVGMAAGTGVGGDAADSTTTELWKAGTYESYREKYSTKPSGTSVITVIATEGYDAASSDAAMTGAFPEIPYTKNGVVVGTPLYLHSSGTVGFKVNMPTEGRYAIRLIYRSVDVKVVADTNGAPVAEKNPTTQQNVSDERSTAIERMLYIDGEIPFKESGYLTMTKTWTDEYAGTFGVFETDAAGNDIRPGKQLSPEWKSYLCTDSTGYNAGAFHYYFSAGEHTVSLKATREAMLLYALEFVPVTDAEVTVPTYAEYLLANGLLANMPSTGVPAIQAENPIATSDRILYPLGDRTSAITYPQDASKIKLNSIGGTGWQVVGQWIRYEIDVPTAGFYNIITRFKQDTMSGMFTSRQLRIDGKIPFAEAANLRFNYADGWQVGTVNDGVTNNGDPFEFYLTAGKHTLEFEVVLGSMGEVLREVSDVMEELNNAYMKFLMITGASPDEYRIYNFKELVPGAVATLGISADRLAAVAERMKQVTGHTGSQIATLNKVELLVRRMYDAPEDEIAKNMNNLKSYLGTLGTWLYTTERQPLQFDYIMIAPKGTELPAADATFWQAAWFEIKQFFMSFVTDYNSVSSSDGEGSTIGSVSVWYLGGRDRAQILRNMVDNKFTPQTKIAVDLKLVAGGVLQSVLAGVGPDVAFLGSSDTINWAIRSALTPLNNLIEMDKNTNSATAFDADAFNAESMVPLTLYGTQYGLPSQMDFYMMFYRIDIFDELNLECPKTWDDFYALLPILQANYMDVAFPNKLAGLNLLLYQMGGELYYDPTEDTQYYTNGVFDYEKYAASVNLVNKDKAAYVLDANGNKKYTDLNGIQINLGSNVALSAFEELLGMFENYRFPLTYDFATRFRTGEMPVGILTYNTYNTLSVYASELRGMWEMVPIPGWKNADGTINHSSTLTVNAIVMPRGVDAAEAVKDTNGNIIDIKDPTTKHAWELMKWFVSTDVQGEYGTELQAVMGSAAKYNTANTEAIKLMSWTTSEANNLAEQMKYLVGVPEVPGSYIVDRYVSFAFLAVYNDSMKNNATSTGADPAESMLDYLTEINKEISRKRKEFDLPYVDISGKK